MQRLRFALALAGLLAVSACGNPQVPNAQNYATVYGRVYDAATNAGIAGAVVIILVSYRVRPAATGPTRKAESPAVKLTHVQISPGYTSPQIPSFSVNNGDRYRLDIPLTHQ